jgi:hypothetical protein
MAETDRRVVAQTGNADLLVSTVFLGLDHNFGGRGRPLLFETMTNDRMVERYATWEEAEAGHKRAVEEAFGPAMAVRAPGKP